MREIVLQLIETVRPMKIVRLKIDFRSECNTGNACEPLKSRGEFYYTDKRYKKFNLIFEAFVNERKLHRLHFAY
jgi:hypothetical protein